MYRSEKSKVPLCDSERRVVLSGVTGPYFVTMTLTPLCPFNFFDLFLG